MWLSVSRQDYQFTSTEGKAKWPDLSVPGRGKEGQGGQEQSPLLSHLGRWPIQDLNLLYFKALESNVPQTTDFTFIL